MVELGDREAEENERFGTQAAAVCDLVVLVGERALAPDPRRPDRRRLPRRPRSTWWPTRPRREALLAKTTRRGDVVLFENDLPDLYAEDGERLGATVVFPRQ